MKLIFFERKKMNWYKWSMKFMTGCPKQHVGFLCEESDILYDMSLQRRHRTWRNVIATHPHILFTIIDAPVVVTEKFLDLKETDSDHYGALDYFYFALRPLYHLLGMTTRNQDGIICSEQVYFDLKANGWDYTFKEVPSPCALFTGLLAYYAKKNQEFHISIIEGGTGRVLKA